MSRFHASSFASAEIFSALSPAHTCCTPCAPPGSSSSRDTCRMQQPQALHQIRMPGLLIHPVCIPRLPWCSSGRIPRRRWPQAETQPSDCAGRLQWAAAPLCTATARPGSSCAGCQTAYGCPHTPTHTAWSSDALMPALQASGLIMCSVSNSLRLPTYTCTLTLVYC